MRVAARALLATGLAAIAIAGCGGDDQTASRALPAKAVASVGGKAIPRAELQAAITFLSPPVAVAQTPETRAAAAKARSDALRTLIRQRWIWRAAAEAGIELEPGAVDRLLASPQESPQGNVGSPTFWRNVLRTELLRKRLVRREIATQDALGDAAVQRYFDSHREELALPERRDMKILAFETRREASAARARLATGSSWPALWRRSLHEAPGGTRPTYALLEGEALPPLNRAVFSATIGALAGPVRTSDGWYVFELTSVKARTRATLSLARDGIETALKAGVDKRFEAELRDRYRAITRCDSNIALPAICS